MSDSDYLLDDDGPEWTVADTARQLALDLQEVEGERDRLRAVVDAVRQAGRMVLAGIEWERPTGGVLESIPINRLADLKRTIDQLDGSGDMGGGDG